MDAKKTHWNNIENLSLEENCLQQLTIIHQSEGE